MNATVCSFVKGRPPRPSGYQGKRPGNQPQQLAATNIDPLDVKQMITLVRPSRFALAQTSNGSIMSSWQVEPIFSVLL